ncbi:hypothetical protein PRIPAC_71913 [Pristionchus pacificus]|uniref:EGF-like domain-containing protein n=1 Tax=Pristionchus pacificus TaxID=54126 RepID=A0A8R1Z5K2_PRIPA|nr:hypothetical protein PRIPAC_71913 [Pristionchus pacificus]
MCWGTLNRLSLFEDIPCTDMFYTKNAEEVGKYRWDGPLNSFDAIGGPLHGITTKPFDNPFHCAELSFCPTPCTISRRRGCVFERHLNIDLLGMMENRWNLTYPCDNNQIYRPDIDICVHKDDCMVKKCPANSICEEGFPTSECICALGYAPDSNGACAAIDLSSIHIPWTSPYAPDSGSITGWHLQSQMRMQDNWENDQHLRQHY